MDKPKWSIGTLIWFVLVILGQWLLFIEYLTRPSMGFSDPATKVAGIVGIVGTALYLWLMFSKTKTAMYTIIAVTAVNALISFFGGAGPAAFLGLIVPALTYLIVRKTIS
ncbi:MAG: hypothetical protein IJS39_06415 [Synergistaceae bacterium]|nr:hypothetical protein [Synergistaceae bacterium]